MKYAKFLIVLFVLSIYTAVCLAETDYFQLNNHDFDREVIPFHFMNGIPVIDVIIQDKVLRLFLDTGADSVSFQIKPQAIKDISVKYLEEQKTSKDVYGKSYQERFFEIAALQLGNLHLTNVRAGEELRNFLPQGADGIIGNNFLRNFYVMIDYQKAETILYSKGNYPKEWDTSEWQKINFEHNKIGILLKGKVDGVDREGTFCLDTGCASTGKGKKFGILRLAASPDLSDKRNSPIEFDHFYIQGIDLGPTSFWVVDLKEPPVDGFLGDNFFWQYRVFIDFEREILFVKKY